MNAVDYLKIKARITKVCTIHCDDCPFGSDNNGTENDCTNFESKYPEQAVEIIEKWSKEHPIKTYLSVLLEKLPDVELDDMGLPTSCPFQLFNIDYRDCPLNYGKCYECWNREYKEETNE